MELFIEMAGPVGLILLVFGGLFLLAALWCLVYTVVSWRGFRDFQKGAGREKTPGSPELMSDIMNYRGRNPGIIFIRDTFLEKPRKLEDFKTLAFFFLNRSLRRVTHRLRFIKLVAVISPLLGLMGTVLGMLTVFRDLSGAARPDPAVLAAGIWQALITTVMGLFIAIPASLAYWYLSGRLGDFRAEALGFSFRIRAALGASEPGEPGA
ncbi:MotA/TolQ/ExbB proton channel family protein [Succinimonas amylolytica]|uniref:MotA/TolQ/ExbB proton channel family protein n=1 Tax=Succinimonas amylolytica TaxID=83769 RepID=UPI00035D03EE|nr:MotA/TolQ/ExbB proton channel family protein [Succinimonas amylolytica]